MKKEKVYSYNNDPCKDIIKFGKKIVKNNKVSPNKKLEMLVGAYKRYYTFFFNDEADLQAFEIYYEKFVIDNVFYPGLCNKYKKLCQDEINYANMVAFTKQLSSIKDINWNLCNESQKKLLEFATKVSQKIYFEKTNYLLLYTNENVREYLSSINETMVNLILEAGEEKELNK